MDAASFNSQDSDAIFALAERLTGNSVRGNLILSNVGRRIEATRARSLFEYLRLAETDPVELPHLISALVVHTTSWFREEPHFGKLKDFLEANYHRFMARPMRVLSAACSTGEEVYSFGLILEAFRQSHPGFDYVIEGRDIDLLCTNKAVRAVYPKSELERIPADLRRLLLEGSGKTAEYFTLVESLRARTRFSNWNLVRIPVNADSKNFYDYILCRNVLIYFSPALVEKVIKSLLGLLADDGALCLGHSESVDYRKFQLETLGNSVYFRAPVAPTPGPGIQKRPSPVGGVQEDSAHSRKLVLVIDDSVAVRKTLTRLLESAGIVAVAVGTAEEATEYLKRSRVDLITLDLSMPGQAGMNWLLTHRKAGMRIPVIIVSDHYPTGTSAVFGPLENCAQDYFHKAQLISAKDELLFRITNLIDHIAEKNAGSEDGDSGLIAVSTRQRLQRPDLVLVGASIGGPEALSRLVSHLPPKFPPLVIVQHISVGFAKAFAESIAQASGLNLPLPTQGLALESGNLYMSQGDYHIGVRRSGGGYSLVVSPTERVRRHRPSVDFAFSSLVEQAGSVAPEQETRLNEHVLAVILTGMGADGAEGLLKLHQTGAMTFAQERKSCVVFGMAKEAIRMGAVGYVGTIPDIRRQIELALQVEE